MELEKQRRASADDAAATVVLTSSSPMTAQRQTCGLAPKTAVARWIDQGTELETESSAKRESKAAFMLLLRSSRLLPWSFLEEERGAKAGVSGNIGLTPSDETSRRRVRLMPVLFPGNRHPVPPVL